MLAAWLQSDHLWAQKAATILLVLLLGKSQSNDDAFFATRALPGLALLLESEDAEVQKAAATVMSQVVAASHQNRNNFVAAGVLPRLANCCSSARPHVQAYAAVIWWMFVNFPPDGSDLVKMPGLIPACVSMLRSDDHNFRRAAVCMVGGLASIHHYGDDIIAAGVLPPLTAILLSAHAKLQLGAVDALASFAFSCRHHLIAVSDHISAAQALPTVLTLLQSAGCGHSDKWAVLRLLRLLAQHSQQNRDSIVAAGLKPIVTALLDTEHISLCHAAAVMESIAAGTQANRDAITASGALPLLAALLVSGEDSVPSMAASTMSKLVLNCNHSGKEVIAAGALPALVALMASQKHQQSWYAACAVARLASGDQESQSIIIAAGALPALTSILELAHFKERSVQIELQSEIAAAFGHLAAGSLQNQLTLVAEGVLPALVGLLDTDEPSLQTAAASVLMHMTQTCQAGRAAVVQAGAAPALAAMLQSDSLEVVQSAAAYSSACTRLSP